MAKGGGSRGVVLGYLKYVLGFDSLAFQDGIGDADKRLKAAEKGFAASGKKIAAVGTGLTAAITAPFIGLIASAVPAATESAQAIAQVNAALKSMGPVAGLTSDQLAGFAGKLQDISNFDDDDILKSVTANLLTFGSVAGDQFKRAELAAVNLSARLGQDLQSSAIQVGKALNDPIKGITALRRVGVAFTQDQKDQIKAMVEVGNVAGAQKIILGELEKEFGGAAKAQRDATPGADAQQAWRTFQETLGAVGLKILPPLTAGIATLLNWFNNLSPAAQNLAIGVAAVAAAVGPIAIGFGSLVALGAPLLAAFGAEGGLTLGLAGLAPILLPLAVAVGGVYLAFKNWDKIGPYIEGVAARVATFVDETDAQLAKITAGADDLDKRMGVPSRKDFFDSISASAGKAWADLNKYDLAAWARGVDASIAKSAMDIWTSFEQMHARVQAAFNGMLDGIKQAIADKLGPAWKLLQTMTTQAGQWFYDLYDKVVGHSYIPDMVDGIAAEMARLDGVMVKPIADAVGKSKAKFHELASATQGILDRLFPDQAQVRDLQGQLTELDKALAAKLISPEVWAAARRRLNEQLDQLATDAKAKAKAEYDPDDIFSAANTSLPPVVVTTDFPTPDIGKPGGSDDAARQAMRDTFRTTFGEGITAALNGDLKGFIRDKLSEILSRAFSRALDNVADKLFDLITGGGSGGGGSILGSILSGIGGIFGGGGLSKAAKNASAFSLPGFAAGGSLQLGGMHGFDTNMLSLNGSPIARVSRGETLFVNPDASNDNGGRRTTNTFYNDFRGADAAAVPALERKLDALDRSIEGRSVSAVGDAMDRRVLRR